MDLIVCWSWVAIREHPSLAWTKDRGRTALISTVPTAWAAGTQELRDYRAGIRETELLTLQGRHRHMVKVGTVWDAGVEPSTWQELKS